ncbi:MAG: hypothetical protein M1338_05535, partial [Patescibacteria group bacterium]|nr:hypothetical protein [Patescibacteria group bacterium]
MKNKKLIIIFGIIVVIIIIILIIVFVARNNSKNNGTTTPLETQENVTISLVNEEIGKIFFPSLINSNTIGYLADKGIIFYKYNLAGNTFSKGVVVPLF